MSQKRYKNCNTSSYFENQTPRIYTPNPVILPQSYNPCVYGGVSNFTPRTIEIQPTTRYAQVMVPQQYGQIIMGTPVLVQTNRAPIAKWVLNPYTGRLELVYY